MQIIDTVKYDPKEVLGRSCVHVTYTENHDIDHDALVVKEYLHMKDGSLIPNLKIIVDYERQFWVTTPSARDHTDKLQYEKLDNLREYSCRQMDLIPYAARVLDIPAGTGDMRRAVFKNPYLYGCQVKPECIIKHEYQRANPNLAPRTNIVAAIDIETKMDDPDNEIIIITYSRGDYTYAAVTEEFIAGHCDDEVVLSQKVFDVFKERCGEFLSERNYKPFVVEIVPNAGEAVARTMAVAHKDQPDFISIFNINFDLPIMTSMLEKYGYDVTSVMSDPRVPEPFRHYYYNEGRPTKETHDGRVTALADHDRWHKIYCTAGFYFADSMTIYRKLRVAAGNEPSYGLDAVLERNTKVRKMEWEETAHHAKGDWHRVMQKKFKIPYIAYGTMDSIDTVILDECVNDIAIKLPAMCALSCFNDFNSGPKRIVDALHFHLLSRGYAIGTTDGKIKTPMDEMIPESRNWITTLPAMMGHEMGLDLMNLGHYYHETLMTTHCADSDIERTYPAVQITINGSKPTTIREMVAMEGLNYNDMRTVGFHLVGGTADSMQFCTQAFKLPTPDDLFDEFALEMA